MKETKFFSKWIELIPGQELQEAVLKMKEKEEDPYEDNFIYRPLRESETPEELLDDDWIINARVELGVEE
jgi:hypothetical protein